MPPNYRSRSETEKALLDSLRDMELQCKERVDLLEALQKSRSEGKINGTVPGGGLAEVPDAQVRYRTSTDRGRAWLGQGTVPAVTYPDIARPAPPPLPQRPAVSPAKKSTSETPTLQSVSKPSSSARPRTNPVPSFSVPLQKKSSRSPSPEKKTGLLLTLRDGKDGKRTSRSPRATGHRKESGPAAAKAATQAWGTLSRALADQLSPRIGEDGNIVATKSGRRDGERPYVGDQSGSSHDVSRDRSRARQDDSDRPASPVTSTAAQNARPRTPRTVEGSTQLGDSIRDGQRENASVSSLVKEKNVSRDSSKQEQRRSEDDTARKLRSSRTPAKQNDGGAYEWPSLRQRGQDSTPGAPRQPAMEAIRGSSTTTVRPNAVPQRALPSDKRSNAVVRRPIANSSTPRSGRFHARNGVEQDRSSSEEGPKNSPREAEQKPRGEVGRQREEPVLADAPSGPTTAAASDSPIQSKEARAWKERVAQLIKNLPRGVDEQAAKQILNEIVIKGDEVHWDDVAGLDVAKNALKEAVVYPFLRPDLFMGLREPARGMLLFGPPGTGKTMLARAVATESKSTFFSISASSLTSKYLGDSEKLVRALFVLAKALAPSIIFVDEIDSLLSSRSGSGEHEASRRIKTEFLIQWSDLARAAAGREQTEKEKERGDASRVLVLAATNLPWTIDEAARRRFVRRQYIPLPEGPVRAKQLGTLLGHQKHSLTEGDIQRLVELTDGMCFVVRHWSYHIKC